MAFTDFDAPAVSEAGDAPAPPASDRSPRARRADFYDTPIVDGKPAPNTPLSRLRDIMRALFVTAAEREEAQLETSLRRLPGVSQTNLVATLSPKGGCGKTTSTFHHPGRPPSVQHTRSVCARASSCSRHPAA